MPNTPNLENSDTERKVPETADPTAPVPPAPSTGRAPNEPVPDEIINIGGGYRKGKRIGRGGFGEVFAAQTLGGGFPVALKIIYDSVDQAEAQRELKALDLIKDLSHAYLLQTREYWSHQGQLHIVMERADCSLRQRYKQCRDTGLQGFPVDELLRYTHETAETLDYLHTNGVHHRDIKPENILLSKGHVKVADLGLASELQKRKLVTVTGSKTPMYSAPEIDDGKISPHSDQYSLAMTYGELRLGRPLFEANSPLQLALLKSAGKFDLGDLKEPEKRVLLKAMAKDPEQRYPSCLAFVEDLERAVVPKPAPVGNGAQGSTIEHSSDDARGTLPARELRPPQPRHGSRTNLDPTDPHMPDWRDPNRQPWTAGGILFSVVLVVAAGVGGYFLIKAIIGDGQETTPMMTPVAQTTQSQTSKKKPARFATLPKNCEPQGDEAYTDAHSEVRYHRKIAYVLPDRTEIVFRLIPPTEEGLHTAFYMMQNKVTNELFGKFANANPVAVNDSHWKKGGWIDERDLGSTNLQMPVLRVTAEEAHLFARWIGGYLPSTAQYDRAAGNDLPLPDLNPLNKEAWGKLDFNEKCRRGVRFARDGFKQWFSLTENEKESVGVSPKGPLPITVKTIDVGPYGCRHVAANGREYTNNLKSAATKLISSVHGQEDLANAEVELRGKSYHSEEPNFWQPKDHDQVGFRAGPDDTRDIGFRVVLYPGK